MKNNFYLKDLNCDAKYFLSAFLIVMCIGISIGLSYVYLTTDMTASGSIEQFNGSQVLGNQIPDKFPKPLENMILTTHNHILNFAMISFLIGFIFYFNSIIIGNLKTILIIEPLISSLLMFASLWIMKYLYSSFVYVMIVFAIATYVSWYIMISVALYELLIKKD